MALGQAGVELIAKGLGAFVADMGKGEKAVDDFGSKGSKGMGAAGQVMTGALRQVGASVIDFAAQGAAALGGFVADSVKQAGDFEAGMNNFQAVANLDTKGLDQFKSLFISLGKELPVSTSEVQQAATELVKGGIDPATIAAGGLKTSLQFAAAGNLELAQAAEIGAKVVGGWTSTTASAADKAAFMASSMDLMSKAANASTVDVDELALGLYNVQGTAKAAGVSFDDTVTTLAAVSSSFNSSSEAGTSMKNFLVRLQPTTKPATAAMAELGLYTKETGSAFYDANGKFVGMEQASALLQNALAGATDAQKVQALQTIFGNDAMGVASKLTELGAAGYANMAQQIAAQASVQETAALKQQGFNTALDNFHGSIEALQITVGGAVIPVLTWLLNNVLAPGVNTVTSFADAVGGNADAFASLPGPLQSVVTVIQAVVTAAQKAAAAFEQGGLSGAISAFGDSITSLDPVIGSFISSLAPVGDVVQDVVDGLQGAGPYAEAFATALQLVTENAAPVAAILAGIAAAFAALSIISTVVGWIGGLIAAWGAVAVAVETSGGVLAAIVAVLGGPVTLALAAVAAAIGLLVVAWTQNWGDIQGKTAAVWAVLQPILDQLGQIIGVVVVAHVQALAAVWSGVLQPVLSAAWSFISGTLIPIIQALYGVELAALKLAISAVSGVVTGVIIPALKDLWKWFTDLIAPITNSKEALGGAKTAGDIAKGAMDALGGAVGWLIGKLGDFVAALKQARDWLNSLKPPDWLVGHSPPPMANWFADIAKSCGESAMAFKDFGQQLDDTIPQIQMYKEQLESLQKPTKAQKKELEGLEKAIDVIVKVREEMAKLRKEAIQAAADMASIAIGNIGFVYDLGNTSDLIKDQQRLADDNAKNLEQQQELKAEIQKNQQLMAHATDEGTQTYYQDILIEQQQQLNDLTTEYNANQGKIAQDQQDINEITQLTADAQKELTDAQTKAAEYAAIDAKLGEKYYSLQSDYIAQLNDLKKKQIEAQSSDEAQMYQQQISLLEQQHDAQMQLFGIEAEERAKELSDMATDAQDAKNTLEGQAYDLAGGIIEGIRDSTADIAQAIGDTIVAGIELAQDDLEISSPSKLTARMLGKPTIQGVAMGIDKGAGDVASALSSAMIEPIASTSQILNSTGGNSYASSATYNYSPTYAAAPKAPQQDFYLMKAGLLPV